MDACPTGPLGRSPAMPRYPSASGGRPAAAVLGRFGQGHDGVPAGGGARVADHALVEVELALEVGVRGVLEAEVAALEHAHEGLDEVAVELGAGDPAQLGDRLGLGDR